MQISCKSVESKRSELESKEISCNDPVELLRYIEPSMVCNNNSWNLTPAEAKKRHLSAWIPCNDVDWIDDNADLFGLGQSNSAEALESSTYARVFRDWLGGADRFKPALAAEVFADLDKPLSSSKNNPILETALALSTKKLIESAKYSIVMDIFLLGGSWGADILRDLAEAAKRGVKVILIHDDVSKFNVANEMDPLWQEALKFSLKSPNFTALAANIYPPARVSSVPFGLERIGGLISSAVDLKVSSQGKSDHSKIIIVDALYNASPEEYRKLEPKVMISSRNMTDSASSFYHDEAIIVKGPAAVVSLLSYQSDIYWAWQQAKKSGKNLVNADDEVLIQGTIDKLAKLRSTSTLVKGQGWIKLQPIQVSGNDEVRNLDTGIISKIMSAERTIDIYDRISYNWPLAMALKEAMARGVKVRVIMDQQNLGSAEKNAVFPYMLMQAPRRLKNGKTSLETLDDNGQALREEDLPIRWFLPLRPGRSFADQNRSDLAQEIHAKTIIIDSRLALFGSANFDSVTWAGGFREFSAWVDDPALAGESAKEFDRLWNHPLLTVSHSVWLGNEAPSPILLQYLQKNQQASGCNKSEELCDYMKIVQGGKGDFWLASKRELFRLILATDTDRTQMAKPSNILQNADGMAECKSL